MRLRFVLVALVPLVTALAAMALLAATRAGAEGAEDQAASGEQIWLRDCAYCHGVTGAGTYQGPDIRTAGTAAVDLMVRTGRMPLPFRDGLPARPGYSAEQVRQLMAYVDSFVTGPEAPDSPSLEGVDLAAGGELYRLDCAACHQAVGQAGALAYGTVGPALDESSVLDVLEAMRTGPGVMPAFPEKLVSQEEAVQIAAYVQYLHDPDDRGGLALWHLGPVPEGLVAWVVGVGGAIVFCRWLGQGAGEGDPRGPRGTA